jgi:hypothetical protein
MEFGVIYKRDDGETETCTVFFIRTRTTITGEEHTEFFVWNHDQKQWSWINSNKTYPIEEKY